LYSNLINTFMDGLRQRQAQFGNPTRLYVLINGSTFSSAMLNAGAFRDERFAAMKLLGEPTGGNPTAP
jgi:C-terminal processing protease CtpA/Prc